METRMIFFRFFFVFLLTLSAVFGAEASADNGERNSRIRVLIVTGGHDYDKPEFKRFIASFPELAVEWAELPRDRSRLAPGLERDFDVLLLYDQDNTPLTDEEKANFVALLDAGIGLFALHHHLSAHQDWDEHYDLIGGRDFWQKDVNLFRGKEYPRSSFIDNVDIEIRIADPDHPIVAGVKPFVIRDEAYGRCPVRPDVHVVLSSPTPSATPQVAWTWRCGKSSVFVNMLGHGPSAWNQPEFGRVFIQAIRYLAKERVRCDEKNN